jgi:SAM-dependent methyltransferase
MSEKRSQRKPRRGWDAVAAWYDGWVGKGGSIHHRKLAIPAVLDLLDAQPDEAILDMGAGQGVLAPYVAKTGAHYTGIDVSPKLLAYARQHHGQHGRFLKADVARLATDASLDAASFDAVVFLLSIQDMDPLDSVIQSAEWALKPDGRAVLLMTHPAFRIPRQSGWGYDENRKLQYRRVDRYLSPLPVPMKQHQTGVTISFHRAIGDYVNTLASFGLLVDQMREIAVGDASLKKNRSKAEKMADDEIPLFLALRARKLQP